MNTTPWNMPKMRTKISGPTPYLMTMAMISNAQVTISAAARKPYRRFGESLEEVVVAEGVPAISGRTMGVWRAFLEIGVNGARGGGNCRALERNSRGSSRCSPGREPGSGIAVAYSMACGAQAVGVFRSRPVFG